MLAIAPVFFKYVGFPIYQLPCVSSSIRATYAHMLLLSHKTGVLFLMYYYNHIQNIPTIMHTAQILLFCYAFVHISLRATLKYKHWFQLVWKRHYNDVIMSTMAYKITGVSIVYSNICSDQDLRKHQSFASLAFVRGIHRWPANSQHKAPVTRKMFPFDDIIIKITRILIAPKTVQGKSSCVHIFV